MSTTWLPQIAETAEPLYLVIVDALAKDVASGRLTTDSRLPTQRDLADHLGIALGTVTRAYAEAERRGLIRSEGRRGTFVGDMQTSRAILSTMARGAAAGIDLSKNHPLPSLDPDLGPALRKLGRSRDIQRLLEYPPAAGLAAHREIGARWIDRLGHPCDPDTVFVTAGAQHALAVICAAETRPGDCIAAEQCTYPGVTALAEVLNLSVMGIPTDNHGLMPDALETVCRRKKVRLLYCNPTLHNPTASIMPRERRQAIASIARKYGVMVIEDEIMRPLIADHPGYIAAAAPDQTYLVVSASKAVAAGLRVGFIVVPPAARQRITESMNASCLGVPPLLPELLALWLSDGTAEAVINRRIHESAARHRLAVDLLRGYSFRHHPAAFHLWLELPDGWSGMKLAMEAQMQGVIVAPAEAFAVDRKPPISAVRLSISGPTTRDAMTRGLGIITDLLRSGPSRIRTTV